MAMLAVIDDIENESGMIVAHPLDDGGEIGGAVEHAAVRLDQDQRRHRLLVVVARHRHDQRAFADLGQAARLQIVQHGSDQIMDGAFAVPQIELARPGWRIRGSGPAPTPSRNAATGRDSRGGHPASSTVARRAASSRAGSALQAADAAGYSSSRSSMVTGDCSGYGPLNGGVEIDRRDAAQFHFGDQLAHLQAPIAQMHVADHMPAIGAVKPLQAIADDGGAQMPHMHGLGDIGPAEIDDRGAALAGIGRAQPLVAAPARPRCAASTSSVTSRLMKPGPAISTLANCGSAFSRAAIFSAMARGLAFRKFCRRQGAIALELRQVGPVRGQHLAERRIQPFGRERLAHGARQLGRQRNHGAERHGT